MAAKSSQNTSKTRGKKSTTSKSTKRQNTTAKSGKTAKSSGKAAKMQLLRRRQSLLVFLALRSSFGWSWLSVF